MNRIMMARLALPVLVAGAAACGGDEAEMASPPLPRGVVELTAAQFESARIVVDTTVMRRVTIPLTVPGTVMTPDTRTSHVGSIVEGRIEEVLVLPGDRVDAGTPLFHIHSHEMAIAHRDVVTAQAQLTVARSAYERSRKLLEAEAVSKEEVERRLAQFEAAQAEQVRSEEIMRHLSPSPTGEVMVRAPRAGTVFEVKVRPGEAVLVGSPLATLGDARKLWVTGFVPENAALRLEPGDSVAVRIDAMPDNLIPGRVVRVSGMVDSLRRAVDVRVELLAIPAGLKPGMFASMLLPAADPVERVVLPADAVQRSAEGDVVFVADGNNRFRRRAVQAVALGNGEMAVAGLPAGVPVVIVGAFMLKSALENVWDDE